MLPCQAPVETHARLRRDGYGAFQAKFVRCFFFRGQACLFGYPVGVRIVVIPDLGPAGDGFKAGLAGFVFDLGKEMANQDLSRIRKTVNFDIREALCFTRILGTDCDFGVRRRKPNPSWARAPHEDSCCQVEPSSTAFGGFALVFQAPMK